jgi:hypothetical protein
MAYLWLALMAVWLAALAYGLWWVWPHFERLQFTTELAGSVSPAVRSPTVLEALARYCQ